VIEKNHVHTLSLSIGSGVLRKSN